ncbi:MAG: LytTR family DNA-binding domain-containing protein [Bacteroidales bacterium]|nr:LytTR family DNA-binding domain-containing protein [Bacteroidales bacterium]
MTEHIRSIIVEDENRSASTLINLLKQYCPKVEVAGLATTVKEGIELINREKPDLVFLDIALPDGEGFNILEKVSLQNFSVIFITAYDKYATKAFEFSAVHYLLKPINYLELQKAVDRFDTNRHEKDFSKKLNILGENLHGKPEKLVLPASDGLEVINLDEIIRFEASHNYTYCHLVNNKQIFVTRPIGAFDTMLRNHHFVRIHSKYIINLKYLKKYIRGKGGFVRMSDNVEISVSKSRKNRFLEKLNEFAFHM